MLFLHPACQLNIRYLKVSTSIFTLIILVENQGNSCLRIKYAFRKHNNNHNNLTIISSEPASDYKNVGT